jgi:peptide/nickel transport system substrate-binding protein
MVRISLMFQGREGFLQTMNEENNSEANTQNNQTGSADKPNILPQNAGEVFQPGNMDSIKSSSEPLSTQTPESKPETLGQPPITNQPVKKKSKKGLLLIIFILLLAIGGAAAWWLTQKDQEADNATTTQKETQEIEALTIASTEGPASVFFPDEGILGLQVLMDHQAYEGLVGWDQGKVTPLIAQSWSNPDQKTWVFKIKPGVKFHTGKDVKAAQVKASLDDLKKYDYWSLFVSTISSVEATGDLELTIKTENPDSLLLNRLSQAYISDLTAADKPGSNGTGAYKLDTTAKNDEKSSTMIAFDEYHGGRPKTRKLIINVYETDEEVANAIKDKKADIAQTVPIPSVQDIVKDSDLANVGYEAAGSFGLYMNQIRTTNTVMKNKDIRYAAALSLDRQALIDELDNKNTPVYQVIPKSLPGYDESIKFPSLDVKLAKETLEKAKYNNAPLEFSYVVDVQPDAPVLIKQLEAAGFNIKEKAYSADNIDTALADFRKGDFDFFASAYSSDFSDARDILGGILSSTESTYPTYNDPTYDKILADSDKEFDPTKRIQLLQQANKRILDELAWIPIRNSTYIAYYAKDLDIKIDFNGGGAMGTYYYKVGRIVN